MDSGKVSIKGSSKRLRSEEARKRRNKMKKNRRKTKAINECLQKKQIFTKNESRLLQLERENTLLKRTLRQTRNKPQRTITSRYSASIKLACQNRCGSIIDALNRKVTVFKEEDISIGNEIGQGVFGSVRKAFAHGIQQRLAVKKFTEKVSERNIFAEALVSLEMSGNSRFPFCFGMLGKKSIVMEYVNNSKTLRDALSNDRLMYWRNICVDIVRAIHDLHSKGIIHNDLHSCNILIRDQRYAKIIDFGKCMMIDNPIVYSIKPGTEKHQLYNKRHCHLAYELRNIPGSKVTPESDIFSIGYNFQKVSLNVSSESLKKLSLRMIAPDPRERPLLHDVLTALLEL